MPQKRKKVIKDYTNKEWDYKRNKTKGKIGYD